MMSQQIASLYASLGFNVDQAGLTAFRTELQKMKSEMGAVLKDTADFNRRLKTMVGRMGQLNNVFNARGVTEWRQRLIASVRRYEEVMRSAKTQIDAFATEVQLSGNKLNWFDNRLNQNIRSLDSYRAHLEPVVLLLERLRGAAGSPLPRVGGGMVGGGSVTRGGQTTRGGGGSAAGGLLEAAGVGAFLRPLLPTGMGLGGMLGAGYGFKELVQAGREMQAMEFKLKAVSESTDIFNRNLKFVRETSNALAMDIAEFGASFSSIFQSAKTSASVEQIHDMFFGFSKYFRTLQMTPDQIKGSLRAIGQMFNKEKVQAEELRGQLGERAAGAMQLFAQAAGVSVKELENLMQQGKLTTDVVLKAGVAAGEFADKQGTIAAALEMSSAKQTLFNNKLKEISKLILKSGLDQFLADLFSVLTIAVSAIGSAAVFVFKAINKVTNSIKALYEYTQEHPLASSIFAMTAALVLLRPILQAVAGIFLSWAVRGLFAINAVNASLLITELRLWGLLGVFTYLFTAFDDFKKGVEDNPLTLWYHMVQLLISEFDLMFATIELGWARLKADPLGWLSDTDSVGKVTGKQDPLAYRIPIFGKNISWFMDKVFNPLTEFGKQGFGLSAADGWLAGNSLGYNPSTIAANANTPTTVNNNIVIDVSKTSQRVQQAVANGDMRVFGEEVAKQMNQQFRGIPYKF